MNGVPGSQPKRAPPTFASGYATHEASEGANYWHGLSLAFAPFLGVTNNPTKMIFGRAYRPGNVAFSGGRPIRSPHGWAWELATTNDSVTLAKSMDVLPIGGAVPSDTAAATAIVGLRKTDATLRTAAWWGNGTSIFDGNGMRFVSAVPGVAGPYGDVFTPGANFNLQDWHVYAERSPHTGGSASDPIFLVDGIVVGKNGSGGGWQRTGNTAFVIGNGAYGQTADLVAVSFLYLWNRVLSAQAIAAISADPGILFRPRVRPVSRKTPPVIAVAPTLASLPVVQGGDIDCILDVGQNLSIASGLRNVGNALARRLGTPRGGLFYDANYGLDVRGFVNAGLTPQQLSQIQGDIASEVSKDPRVENPSVTVTPNLAAASLSISITCDLAEGPFTFLVGITALTATLLDVQALS